MTIYVLGALTYDSGVTSTTPGTLMPRHIHPLCLLYSQVPTNPYVLCSCRAQKVTLASRGMRVKSETQERM